MLETARLIIRPWTPEDIEAFFELTQDRGFAAFPITDWRQKSLESARAWINQVSETFNETKMGPMAVIEKSTGEVVGLAALRVLNLEAEDRPEITYRFRESAWGKGFATEAAVACLNFGFTTHNFKEIAASITPDNEGSIKVAMKLGMKWTNRELILGIPAEIYRIQREEFFSNRQ